MKKSVENSYDIALARDLSCALTDRGAHPVPRPPVDDGVPYTRFPRAVRGTAPVLPTPAADGAPDSPLPDTFVTWGDLLTWCMEMSRARSAFVLDADGFVVAHLGEEPVNGFDGMGAELAYAMDFLGRVDERAGVLRSVSLEFGKRAIFGFRVMITESVQLVVGIVTAGPIPTEMKQTVLTVTTRNLLRMT